MASERIYDEASKMFNDIDYEQFPHQLATRILAEKASELENLIEANVESRSSSSDNSLGKHCNCMILNDNFIQIKCCPFSLFRFDGTCSRDDLDEKNDKE